MIGQMTSTVLDQSRAPVATDGPPRHQDRAGRHHVDVRAPIERPRALTIHRLALTMTTIAVLAVSLVIGAGTVDDDINDTTLRLLSLALGIGLFVSHAAFGVWALRRRTTIDGLRWQSFRRDRWGGWWSVVWTSTPVVALAAFGVIETATNSVARASWVLLGLVAVRILSLDALGANMRRVVVDGRRWVRSGALAVALADFLVVVIVWVAVVRPELDRDLLRVPTTILPMGVLLVAMFSLGYAKRVERWVREWWDKRWGCTEQAMLEHFGTASLGGARVPFEGRRLIPTRPLRLLVVASYLAVAGTTAWSGWTVWTSRDLLDDASGLAASLERLDEVSGWFVGALVSMQVCHAAWCVAQAWNARRCTLAAPSTLATSVLFLLGPAIVAGGFFFVDGVEARVTVIAAAIVVGLATWTLSFSLVSRMLRALGRSTDRIASWGAMIALHWLLLFGVCAIIVVDDAAVFAGLIVAVAAIGASIFLKAAVLAQIAMREVERATVAFDQVRRRPVSRRRWSRRSESRRLRTGGTGAVRRAHP